MEPFTAWVDFQEEMLKLQRLNLEAASKALDAGGDVVAAQKAVTRAAQAGVDTWKSWLRLWGWK